VSSPLDDLPSPDVSAKRIYAYKLKLVELGGRIKVGETGRTVGSRVKEQVNTAGLSDVVEILMDEPAVTLTGRPFRDSDVHEELKRFPDVTHLVEGGGVEWFQCSIADVKAAYNSVVHEMTFTRVRDKSFRPRGEQVAAVDAADAYFTKALADGLEPRFLWNAKMRFGKTFATYHLAKRRDAKRILVVTYRPAVEDAWETDATTHTDFEGWQFFSRSSATDPATFAADTTVVCFCSLQDLRGRTEDGSIKEHHEWIYATEWDIVVVDEYHYGAWNDATKQLLAGEISGGEAEVAAARGDEAEDEAGTDLVEKLDNVKGKAFLCLSGTPFRAIASSEFSPDQIFNWTYTDEQRAKELYARDHLGKWNPYAALPQMNLLVYLLPDRLREVALAGARNEFDLNEFFRSSGTGGSAAFAHKDQVQGWLDWLRGQDVEAAVDVLAAGTAKPFPYADTNVLPYMNHTAWFLPSVASVFAMKNLLAAPQNASYWGQFSVEAVAGTRAGIGVAALPPVRLAIGSGYDTKTITLTCGKLLTGVTIPQWSAILMLSNLEAPESYFQAAFRVQSPWSVWNPTGDDPNYEQVIKPACLVIDFAPSRALRLFADYGMRLGEGRDADADVRDLARFLPVLGFDGTRMREVDVETIIDIAFESTSIDTRAMSSKKFINASLAKLESLSDDVRQALGRVTRAGDASTAPDDDETTINDTPEVGRTSGGSGSGESGNDGDEDKSASDLEDRLTFLAKRMNAYMYLSDIVEKNIKDVLDAEENELFRAVFELDSKGLGAVLDAGLLNEQAMRLAIHQFRRADEASFTYTGLNPRAERAGDATAHAQAN
jgi:hypothetical protein